MSQEETAKKGEYEQRPERTTFSLVLELSTLSLELARVTKRIRARGIYVAKDLHRLQERIENVRSQLAERVNPVDKTLLKGLTESEKAYESEFISLVSKGI